jgi:hypothetical protein
MVEYNAVVDSGKRQKFDTGSVRDTQERKGRYDLMFFIALERLAIHLENGANKYGDNNFRLGQPLGRYVSSAIRHISKWVLGWQDEDHLGAAIWNLCALLETEEMIRRGKLPEELDDRWKPFLDDYEWHKKNSNNF